MSDLHRYHFMLCLTTRSQSYSRLSAIDTIACAATTSYRYQFAFLLSSRAMRRTVEYLFDEIVIYVHVLYVTFDLLN